MKCLLSNYEGNPDYSELLYAQSGGWMGFIFSSILAMVVILIIKLWQLYNFDIIRAIYNEDHGKFKFNVAHFAIFNLLWASLVHGHFFFYNFVFNGHTEPCVGGSSAYDSTESLFNDRAKVDFPLFSSLPST